MTPAAGPGPFPEIVGQPRATGVLGRALSSGRLFPSLIFHGPPGTGKLATALAFCRALICPEGAGHPRDRCRACRRIDERALVHPDVCVVFPETRKKFEEGEPETEGAASLDLQERQAEAAANLAWQVLIDRIRQAIRFLHRRPSEGTRSVLIVDQANRMDAPAANALLKILEEPPPHAVLILTTSSLHALLPTIRSRCRAVPFQLVSRSEITSYLVEKRSMGPEEATLRSGLSGGRIGAALDLDLEEFRRRREDLFKVLEELARRGDPGIVVARAEVLARGAASLEEGLEILMTILRDLLLLGAALEAGPEAAAEAAPGLINYDLAPRLADLAARLGPRGPDLIQGLERTLEAIRRKGNRQLLVEDFFMGLLPGAALPAPPD
ncbi:MAG: AAA family ATPase [Acidobacteria bacterium]|nr:AAA family ATPase [Acidobacteriota bacterium]